MKIAMVYDAAFPFVKGGGERRYYELARRLSRRHHVELISWQYWPGPSRMALEGVSYQGVGPAPRFYGGDGRRRFAEAFLFATKLLPLLARRRFDVIDCASVPFLPIFTAAAASRMRGSRLVTTWFEFWDTYWTTYLGRNAGRAARTIERRAARAGDAQIAISRLTADRMAPYRRASIPLAVIEPGVDIDTIEAAPAAEKRFDLAFAGRLNAQKNVDLLLHAIAHAARGGERWTCVIIGDGPERQRLVDLARALGIAERVHFTGRIADDAAFYSAIMEARVFAWPSVAEGFGIAPLEAMACGLPVVAVASEFSATAAMVSDGETGLVVENDAQSFAAAVRTVLDDDDLRLLLSQKARARARRSSWDQMADQVEAVYRSIAGSNTR